MIVFSRFQRKMVIFLLYMAINFYKWWENAISALHICGALAIPCVLTDKRKKKISER